MILEFDKVRLSYAQKKKTSKEVSDPVKQKTDGTKEE
jgi:hypothetical protein